MNVMAMRLIDLMVTTKNDTLNTYCSWLLYFLCLFMGLVIGEPLELLAIFSALRLWGSQNVNWALSDAQGRVKLIMVMTTFNESCGCAHTELDGDYTQMASSYNMYHSQNTLDTMRYISMLMCTAFALDYPQMATKDQCKLDCSVIISASTLFTWTQRSSQFLSELGIKSWKRIGQVSTFI